MVVQRYGRLRGNSPRPQPQACPTRRFASDPGGTRRHRRRRAGDLFPLSRAVALAPCRSTSHQEPLGVPSFHNSNFRLLKVNFIIEFFIIGLNRSASPGGHNPSAQTEGAISCLNFSPGSWKNQSGATAIEYGLIAAGISVAIIAAVNGIGTKLNTSFGSISTQLK